MSVAEAVSPNVPLCSCATTVKDGSKIRMRLCMECFSFAKQNISENGDHSLWQSSIKMTDKETMELMNLFYTELAKTKDIDIAFKIAQKTMRFMHGVVISLANVEC